MPHISKRHLNYKLYQQLSVDLHKAVSTSGQRSVEQFMTSILTPTEQVMLTKRFAAVMFLEKGMTNYEIWNTLELSPSTVARIQKAYEDGKYDDFLSIFSKKKKGNKNFLDTLEVILQAGLPPRGKGKWKKIFG